MAAGQIPGVLRDRLGSEATIGLMELLDETRSEWSEEVFSIAADRFECRLAAEAGHMREDFRRSLEGVTQELAKTRFELIKWSFLFWVGQVVTTVALLGFVFHNLKP